MQLTSSAQDTANKILNTYMNLLRKGFTENDAMKRCAFDIFVSYPIALTLYAINRADSNDIKILKRLNLIDGE